jgi:hypothetical protein
MWEVFLNKRSLGIIETNWPWASRYWSQRCSKDQRFVLKPLDQRFVLNPL